jgi:hypothetical protein
MFPAVYSALPSVLVRLLLAFGTGLLIAGLL